MYSFKAILVQNKGMDAAYVEVPMDIRKEFGKGRLKVEATFDGVPYIDAEYVKEKGSE